MLERLQRVLEHVEVMVGVLGHSLESDELGQNVSQSPEAVEVAHGRRRSRQSKQSRELALQPLAAHRRQPSGGGARRLDRRGLRLELEGVPEAHQAHDAHGVGDQRVGRAKTQAARLQVGAPAQRVDELPRAHILRQRVDGEIAGREVRRQALDPAAGRSPHGR